MAEKSRKDESLSEIKQRVDRSRDQLGRDLMGLRYELDIPLKIRKSFQRNTVLWIAAVVGLGLVFTILPARKKKIYVNAKGRKKKKESILEAGLLLGALKVAASVLKPVLVSYAVHKIKASGSGSRRKW
jgi:hypothetical protein